MSGDADGAGLFGVLARAASLHGDRVALRDAEGQLTYRELLREVAAMSAGLGALGLSAGDRLSILHRNDRSFLAAYYAAARAGAILNPLNHRLAPAELAAVLEDAGPRLLLVADEFRELAERSVSRLSEPPRLVTAAGPGRAGGASSPPVAVGLDDVAHLYYTSGTTGRSKGVMLTHRNVLRHAAGAARALDLSATDRWGHIAPMFHLADAWACFAVTMASGCHVMVPRFEAAAVLDAMDTFRVTATNLVPTMLNLMVRDGAARGRDWSALRLLLSGGAPIAPAVVRDVIETFGCEYAQTYGLTETSPYLTLGRLPPGLRELPPEERLAWQARTGLPVPWAEVEVVDAAGRPVPRDDRTVGEIRARGESVSPGYWRLPGETRAVRRDGWFYTGDLAVVDRTGSINIVDRAKDTILTGGESVYSIEVENVLYAQPGVLECAVVGLPDPVWGEVVTAAVVPRPGVALDDHELELACRAQIAGYKVPRRFVHLAGLPRTGSGKIAKAELRRQLQGG